MDINGKLSKSCILYFLVLFAPMALILEYTHSEPLLIFIFAAIALIPLAKLIGDSTEHLAEHYGPTVASLLNVTFGNAAEIIIGIIALSAGLVNLVKASIIGSIIGNILLIFGLSLVVGGLKQKEQFFNKENTSYQSSMLFLAIIGLAIPSILSITVLSPTTGLSLVGGQGNIQFMSNVLAFVLLGVYLASIIFTFVTHKHLFAIPSMGSEEVNQQRRGLESNKVYQGNDFQGDHTVDLHWSKKKCIILLGASVVGVVLVSEVLVSSVELTIKKFGFGEMFVGAIIVGIVGNAAEHSSAILLARRGKLDLSIGIAAGSGTQVAIFVVPILVITGIVLNRPFNLVFTIYELVMVFLATLILNLIARDGKSNWFEGIMLTAVYIMIAVGFFFVR
ncbi:MAG TPA: calcium/proton exchanger [Candidatus Nitrosopolaris sp.]|nr:calcium/proton exchanger [Candidatus Nitrosopolaris sp.]